MRAIATIYGVGKRKTGIGKKTGKKYDFVEVSIGYGSTDFVGEKCETVAIDAALIGDRTFGVGERIDLVMHQVNFKTFVDAIID